MESSLPNTSDEFMDWTWEQMEPFYEELKNSQITEGKVAEWLHDWTQLGNLIEETYARLIVATTINTADKAAEERYCSFLDTIYPPAEAADQVLKEKLLASGLEPEGFKIPLRNMRAEADLFREANLLLLSKEQKLCTEYDKIIGDQTVEWEGEEITVEQLRPVCQSPNRKRRERAWRLGSQRWLQDRQKINDLWLKFISVRRKMAKNAGFPNYTPFRWTQLLRFDYKPEDCKRFQKAIEDIAVPAATRVYQKYARQLGVSALRPWDLDLNIYPIRLPALHPFKDVSELESIGAAIFKQVDPDLGKCFEIMRTEGLLDLDNRKNKAPGGYTIDFPQRRRPFIFMNTVGLHDDVQTLHHETGHAYHSFKSAGLPYRQQRQVGMEFAEVASMTMELLTLPYLSKAKGGYYSGQDAGRASLEHIENMILFWPYMAVVDVFQHWVYENADAALDPANCDACWKELWDRFIPGVNWSGLEDEAATGWHRKMHIHQLPFYYVEYGIAQLGAVQIWRNSLQDLDLALTSYRKALSLGGSVPLPELYATAGVKFAPDVETLSQTVYFIQNQIAGLEAE